MTGAGIQRSGLEPKRLWASLRSYGMAGLAGGAAGLLLLISPWVALVLVLGGVLLGIGLSKPINLCYLLIITIAFTSGIERGRLIPLFMPNEVLLLLAVGIVFLLALVDPGRKMHAGRYFFLAFVLLVGGMVVAPIAAYIAQDTELTINNAFKMVAPIQYFLLFWLFAVAPQDEKDRRRAVALMLICGGLIAVVGLLQAAHVGVVESLLENFYASSHEDMAANAGRVTSLLGAWNNLGILMMFTVLAGLVVLPEISHPVIRAGTMGLMVLSALCLVASGSFAGILGVVMGIPLSQALARRRMNTLPILILCSIGVVIALLFFEPLLQPLVSRRLSYQYEDGGLIPHSLTYRFWVWQDVFLPPILEHLPWPVYPTVPTYYDWQYEESQYILLLFRTGLSGFVGFVGWLALTAAWLYRRLRQSSGFTHAMVNVALTFIIVLSIAGFTNEVFSFAGSTDYMWMLLGMVANSTGDLHG